ncbi:hypothetical protein TCAL_00350 [Tigriopus californicus]|uniref:Protein arginine methyltransferase NDUFAF7 n=1 Tax=Tigriopus californicus TaxID=6832 RepID=A0A553NBR1_TIGCA|nr:protein arginine methyltransferase NDUFAF7, mitochondrial-like [Tigriopus californicus]TRY62882.1 hypothetical protein TCAL_00350 [Tigriopus californicus]|eukprot:TCALIF_00350-PA protein Name:"Similar to ndufaf7 NADH dehydrogenase [ubiquinone] complex I, assembly factor 7 (Xenopus tropicalis)" AED:0.01 eAED:0.01 QI:0/-1/0/1/-1/1/1/0/408
MILFRRLKPLYKSPLVRHCSQIVQKDPPNRLLNALGAKIRFTGPITVAEYMKECLTNPLYGYYAKHEVFGASGDFVTSPEVSQMFGECLGIWYAHEWIKMGKPQPWQFVELGPGKGTLMSDILRTIHNLVPDIKGALTHVHLVEVSDRLQKVQKTTLCPTQDPPSTPYGQKVTWHRDLSQIPDLFTFFLAHEFFDALPIHKFVKTDGVWREVLIDCDKDGQLTFVKSRHPTPACSYIIQDQSDCQETEICPLAGMYTQLMSDKVDQFGGAALIADYGHNGDKGDTLRGFRNHSVVDPLKDPGLNDLTADVDFNYLARNCSEHVRLFGPVPQKQFLLRLGLQQRLAQLIKSTQEPSAQKQLLSAFQKLTEDMGQCFKFSAVFPKSMEVIHASEPPAGFEPTEQNPSEPR